MPETVVTIGSGVFNNKTNLTGVTIHNNVATIHDNAFDGCVNLETVIFDGTWTKSISIGKSVFNGCINLKQVVLPDALTEIGDAMFYQCLSLVWANIPTSATRIGKNAFFGCTMYKGSDKNSPQNGLFIPKKVTSIEYRAFYGCTALEKVVFEDGTENLYMYDMNGAYDKTSTVLAATFSGCKSLKAVTLPNRLKNIGASSFATCALTEITIPASVEFIGASAFANSTQLKNVYFADRAADGSDTLEVYSSNLYKPFRDTIVEEIHLPNGLTRVSEYMFVGMSQLKKVYLPNTIHNTTYKDKNNTGCAIGSYAFSGCTELIYVEVAGGGTGAVSVAPGAFYNCRKLSTVIMPDKLSTYTDANGKAQPLFTPSVFENCYKLENITITEGTDNQFHSVYGMVTNADKTEIIYCPFGKSGVVVIPSYITS
ncbi:MAG: leucine-rich repeat domain-containing protein, partial [Clostridiales bacterium]|nr:leucine-rich repeat domain-containing protein [Clostridiales bacterium]